MTPNLFDDFRFLSNHMRDLIKYVGRLNVKYFVQGKEILEFN